MAGTTEGGKKAAITTRKRLGKRKLSELRRKAAQSGGRGYFGKLKEENPEKLREIIAAREARRKAKLNVGKD